MTNQRAHSVITFLMPACVSLILQQLALSNSFLLVSFIRTFIYSMVLSPLECKLLESRALTRLVHQGTWNTSFVFE